MFLWIWGWFLGTYAGYSVVGNPWHVSAAPLGPWNPWETPELTVNPLPRAHRIKQNLQNNPDILYVASPLVRLRCLRCLRCLLRLRGLLRAHLRLHLWRHVLRPHQSQQKRGRLREYPLAIQHGKGKFGKSQYFIIFHNMSIYICMIYFYHIL